MEAEAIAREKVRWGTDEIAQLQKSYDNPRDRLEDIFPNRTWSSIEHECNRLGLCRKSYGRGIGERNRDPVIKEKIAEGKTRKIKKPSINPDLAYFLGSLVGDGSVSKQVSSGISHHVVIFDGGQLYCERIASLLNSLFGLSPRVSRTKSGFRVQINSKKLYEFLTSFCSFGSKVWQVPHCIMQGAKDIKSAFLRGLFDAEGYVHINWNQKRGWWDRDVRILLRNGIAIRQLNEMLQSLGIKSSVRLDGKDAVLYIRRYPDIKSFRNMVGFSPWGLVTKGGHKGEKKTNRLNLILATYGGKHSIYGV